MKARRFHSAGTGMTISDMSVPRVFCAILAGRPQRFKQRCIAAHTGEIAGPWCRNSLRAADGAQEDGRSRQSSNVYRWPWVGGLAFGIAASSLYAQAPGTSFKDCPDCPEMVVVPSGNFLMGSVNPYVPELREAAASRHLRAAVRHRQIRGHPGRVHGGDGGPSEQLSGPRRPVEAPLGQKRKTSPAV